MTPLEGTRSRSRNNHGVTVAPLPKEEIISGIAPHFQYNGLYARILVAPKTTKTWVGNYRKENITPHPFGILLKNNNDKGKG